MKSKLIQQGAEAKILLEGNNIIKDRVSKGYRHPDLDKKLIKRRTKSEAKLLEKTSRVINAPTPEIISFNQIKMHFIKGRKLSETLEKLDWKKISKKIGNQIAKIHDEDIIHGDLTTSNMIWEEKQKTKSTKSKEIIKKKPLGVLHFIDFGLGFHSSRVEDKAVDLHLIKQALEAKHFNIFKESWNLIEKNYNSKDKKQTLEQLKKVELRGRYKH